MSNARQSGTANDAAQVSQHQTHITFNGDRDKTGNNRRCSTQVAESRAYFREYAMRGSLAPHPTRLSSPSTNEWSGFPLIVLNAGTLGPATCTCQFVGQYFANTQREAVRHRIPLGSGLQAPNTYHSRRSARQTRESLRRRGELVGLRALFCEYAMQGALPPHPTLLAFTKIKQAHTITVEKVTSPILEGPGVYSLV
jgi:hypothetical protein